MSNRCLTQEDIDRLWGIFSWHAKDGFVTGDKVVDIFKEGQRPEAELEKLWDLADIDKDGKLDFEEFCVAMSLLYDLINGQVIRTVPQSIPNWLIPESKAYLVQANEALSGRETAFENTEDGQYEGGNTALKDGFDWYMSPEQTTKYEDIYRSYKDARGEISFASLKPLYNNMDIPDTDIKCAWSLVNPTDSQSVGHEQTMAYIHILSSRCDGFKIPTSAPANLRASFERVNIDYNLDNVKSPADRKAKFGDAYASRISQTSFKGTDFGSSRRDSENEESQLVDQLAKLENQIKDAEAQAARSKGSGRNDSKAASVKRGLEQLLQYKQQEFKDVQNGEGKYASIAPAGRLTDDVALMKERIEGLEAYLSKRDGELSALNAQLAEERVR